MSVVAKSTKVYSGFAPTQIPGCALWLDAADRSSLTLSGSSVTAWADKSGNGGNATQITSGNRPTFVGSGVVFNAGSSQWLQLNTPFASTHSIFIVATPTSATNVYMFGRNYTGGGGGSPSIIMNYTGTSLEYYSGNDGSTRSTYGSPTSTFIAGYIRTYGSSVFGRLNGTQIFSAGGPTSEPSSVAWGALGQSSISTNYYTGTIYEFMIFNTALTTAQCQQIEGYLAQKWGLASIMPATHPFGVSIAPSPQSFSPRDIDGCAVWLDAYKVNGLTTPADNSLVSSWVNLVGGSNFIQATASRQPTFLSNGLTNGYPAVFFNSSNTTASIQYLFAGPNVQTTKDVSVFYVSRYTDVGGGQTQIDLRKDAGGTALRTFKVAAYQIRDSAGNLYTMSYTPTTAPSIKSYRDTLNTIFGYLNGSQVASSTGVYDQQAADSNGIYLGCHFDSYNNSDFAAATFSKVYFSEVIIYNRYLSIAEQQQVEGYLAWKWGLIPNIPPSHPYKLALPYVRPFSPRDITGCALWLDAADTSTFSLSGNTVTQWRDKSGSGNNGTPIVAGPTLVSNALNDMPGVTFPSAANLLLCGTLLTGTNFSMIAVIKYSPTAGNQQRAVGQWKRYYNSGMQFTQGQGFLIQAGQSEQFTIGPTSGADTAATHIYSAALNSSTSSSTATLFAGVDGNTLTYTNSSGPNVDTAVTQFAVGGLYEGGSAYYPVKGYIHEVIVYKQTLSIAQLAQIEGYLAWKWNLTSNLPAAHPFEDKPPYAQPFLPTNVPGCSVWLDAADTGSVIRSGSNVTQWSDKSGNGKNATTSANFPTYSTNSLNGKATVRFAGASGTANFLDIPAFDFGTSQRSIFFVIQNTGPSSGAGSAPHWFWPLTGNSTNALSITGWNYIDLQAQSRLLSYTPAKNAYIIISIQFGSTSGVGQVFTNGISEGTITKTVGGTSFANATSGYRLGWLTGSTAIEYSFDGNIAEMILFNTAVSTIQRQQVEGYLAWKWGLTPFLSVVHPFKYSSPPYYIPPFTPTDLAGCALWLDATDSTSLTLSGSNVTTWADKSGNGRNATGYNNTATYNASGLNTGYPGLEFSSTKSMRSSVASGVFSNAVSGFVVYKFTGSVNSSAVYGLVTRTFSSTNGTPTPFDMYSYNGASYRLIGNGTSYTLSTASPNYITNTTPTLYTFGVQSSANTRWNESINGTSAVITTSGGTGAAYGDTGSFVVIGGRLDTAVYFQGVISEVIFYNTALTTTQRQMVENYLSWKWGLNQSLVVRPNVRPLPLYTRPVQLTDIITPALWLDGGDRTTITFSGSNITQWNDKSGNGRNAVTQGSSYPTYSENSILVAPPQYMNCANTGSLLANTAYTVFVVEKFTGPSAGAPLFGDSGGAGDNKQLNTAYMSTSSLRYANYANDLDVTFTGTNVARIWTFNQPSTANRTIRLNGALIGTHTNSTKLGALVSLNLWGVWGYTGGYTGNFYEFIVVLGEPTLEQQQRVEGYLAWKWGMSSSVATAHPFKRAPSLMTTFSPTQIPGALVWLDAMDNTTLSLSGTSVISIRDKVRNALFTPSGATSLATLQPNTIQNNQSIFIDNTGSSRTSFSTLMNSPSVFSAFIVWKNVFQPTRSYEYIFAWYGGAYFNPGAFVYGFFGSQTGGTLGIWDNYSGGGGTTLALANQTNYIGYTQYPSSVLSLNGNTPSSRPLTVSTVATVFAIGSVPMYLGEIILYDTNLSTAQRQQVEGYLAWKWGLVGNLPSTHPYKKFTP